jgi:dipeptidyl aminopeptidase/acylaminoacyl peptidase
MRVRGVIRFRTARLLIWPDENHWILKGENSRVFYREVRAWLEKYLLPASAGSQ